MMHIRVSGKHLEIGQTLPVSVREKLSASITKYYDRAAEATVIFSKERENFRSDCTLHLSSGTIFQVQGKGRDAYRAFDAALSHLDKRVRRYMRRLKDRHGPRRALDAFPAE